MKDTKRRVEFFTFYDRTSIEAHLERMAERGWLLEKMGLLWVYRRIEPKKLTFSVCYFPKASQFDPGPSEEQETFYDFCRHSGWTLAAASAQMQIFYSERPDPVPIETDPALEVETIHRSAKKSVLLSNFILLGTGVLECAMFLWQFSNDPITFLADSSLLFASIDWVILFLYCGVELGFYFIWYARAKRAAERGEFLNTKSHLPFQTVMLVLLTFNMIGWVASMAYSVKWMAVAVTSLLSVLVAVTLVRLISQTLKRWNVSARANRTITFLSAIVLSFASVGVITFGVFSSLSRGRFYEHQETYEYDGRTVTVRRDELPLTVNDLLGIDHDNYSRERDELRSFLLTQIKVRQYPRLVAPGLPDLPWLDYSIVVVKASFLYDLCRDALLNKYKDDPYWDRSYVSSDAALWGAVEAYQLYDAECGPRSQYLLCYPDRIVEIDFDHDWDATPEQMALVGERLGRATS